MYGAKFGMHNMDIEIELVTQVVLLPSKRSLA